MRADRSRNSIEFATALDPYENPTSFHLSSGRLTMRIDGREQLLLAAGDAATIAVGHAVSMELSPFDPDVTTVPRAQVAAVAAEHDSAAGADLRFTSATPVSPQLQRYWNGVIRFVHHELLGADSDALSPLVVHEMGAPGARLHRDSRERADHRRGHRCGR